VHVVGFTIEIYYDARPYELQIYACISWLFVLRVFDENNNNNNNLLVARFLLVPPFTEIS